jgi:signal transduction histidine kinase
MTDEAEDRLVRLVHDLRSPLTVIQGFAELLERRGDALSREQHDEYVARIATAAHDLGRILDEEREERAARHSAGA